MNTTVLNQEFTTTLGLYDLLHRWSFGTYGNSAQAADTEWLYIFILWVNIISFLILLVPIVYFPIKFRRGRQKANYQVSAAHNTPLELAWSIIPLLIMVPIFFWGFEGYIEKLSAPKDSEEINVVGQKWNWTFTYKNGAQPGWGEAQMGEKAGQVFLTPGNVGVPVMAVPAGRPVKMLMRSSDVLHAFFIPDFRLKMDVQPNRYTSLWFKPLKATPRDPTTGKYVDANGKFLGHHVYCAEYCGHDHSEMAAGIVVVEPAEYEKLIHDWATKIDESLTPIEVGQIVAKRRACVTCHSADGTKGTGPTWKDAFGSTQEYTDGSTHVVDENWLVENILYSQKRVVKGYTNQMPVYAGQLKPRELEGLIAYIKSLSPSGTAAEPAADAADPTSESAPKSVSESKP